MVVDKLFVDTNVLVHANTLSSGLREAAQRRIDEYAQAGAEMWISRQIMREYMAVLSRPQVFTKPVPMSTIVADVRRFEAEFKIAEDGPAVMQKLLKLVVRAGIGGKHIHDANIVATMLAHGITHVLTENTSDFDSFKRHISIIALQA